MAAVSSAARSAFADVEILEIRVGVIKIIFSTAAAPALVIFLFRSLSTC